jgi:hypothetical protein
MADSKVPYQDPAVEDRSLATQTFARAGGIGGVVHREEVCIGNPSANAAVAEVLNANPSTEYGLVVRPIPSGTQTVSGTVTANIAAGSNNIGDVDVLTVPAPLSTAGGGTEATALRVTVATDSTGVLSVDDNGASLTVDGTVTANAGTNLNTSALNLEATQSSVLTSVQLIDDSVATLGTSTYTETSTKALVAGAVRRDADTSAVNTDNEIAPLVVNSIGALKVEIFDGGDSFTVDNAGTFATQATLQTGDNTVGRVKLTDGTDVADVLDLANSNPLTVAIVDGSGTQITSFGGGTQYAEDTAHVSGDTLTLAGVVQQSADAALSSDGDRSLLQVDATGYLKVNVKAGSAGATEYVEDAAAAANPQAGALIMVRSDTPATITDANGDNVALRSTNYGAAYVQVVSSSGSFVDTFGGGTQYTEGDVDATITGTAAMMEVAANTLQPVQGTVADGLLVNLGANNDVTVTGSVTANAGTNLNTSALNLEATQASVLTSVQLIDDPVATLGTTTYTETSTKGMIVGAVRRDADTTLVDTTNEVGPLQMDANGRLKVEAFSGETLPVSLTSTTITGTVAVTQSGTWDEVGINDSGNSITVDAAAGGLIIGDGTNPVVVVTDGADNLANTNNELVTAALNYAFDGTNWDRVTNGGGTEATALRVTLANDSTGLVSIDDNGGSLTVDAAAGGLIVGDGTNPVVVLADGADNTLNSANQLVTAAMNYAFDGTTWDRVTNGGGTEATAMRVTVANDSTGVLSVDDNGASLSVDWNGTQPVTGSGTATGALRVELANNGTGTLSTVTTVTTVSTLTNQSQEGGVAISLNAGAVDTGTRRVVQANGAGKTILSAGGSASASGNNTLVAAGTNRLKVFAFSLTTTSATAMTCIFQSGAGGTELWRVIIQAPSGANSGANLSVSPPAWLFATASATLLNLNLSSANAVHWSVSYYDEA